jgi:general secretion pathway protein D
MRDADLAAVIDLIGSITGKTFIVDPRVRGRVTIVAQQPLTPEEAYGVFLNVLELNRFTVVEGPDATRIVPMQIAKEISGQTLAAADPMGGFITRVIQVRNAAIPQVMEIVRPLLPAEAALTAYPETQMIVISDQEANVRKVEALIREIDSRAQRNIDTIRLENASARSIAETLTTMGIASAGMSVQADARTNSLVVSGPAEFIEDVRLVAYNLDQPVSEAGQNVIQLRYADATELATTLSQLYTAPPAAEGAAAAPPSVVADARTNSLIVSVQPDVLPAVRLAVARLDQRPKQVRIEAVIFEVSASRFADLGFQFGALINGILAGGVQFASGPGTLTSLITSILAGEVPDPGEGGVLAGLVPTGPNSGVAGLLRAIARDNTTNILSTPSVITLDNEEAEIVVARNVPFVTGRFSTVGETTIPNQPFQTIEREDVGLTLKVTPHITPADGTVRLEIEQEVSSLTGSAAAAGGEITDRRAINTHVIVGDQRLILLGGLIQEESSDDLRRTPGLGNLPVLGQLFRTKSARQEKRILLLLLRPTIMDDETDAAIASQGGFEAAEMVENTVARSEDGRDPASNRLTLDSLGRHLAQPPSDDPVLRLPLPPAPPGHDRW